MFQVFIQAIDEFSIWGRYGLWLSLCGYRAGLCPTLGSLDLYQRKSVLAILLHVLAFLTLCCSEADAFIGASLLELRLAPVLAFLVIGPMLDIKNLLMMKHISSASSGNS